MRSALSIVLAAALPAVAQEVRDDKVENALKALDGTRVVESAVDSKEGIGGELGWEFVFAGDKVTRQNPHDGQAQTFVCVVDPSASPRAIDLIWTEEQFVLQSIYEIEGNMLR